MVVARTPCQRTRQVDYVADYAMADEVSTDRRVRIAVHALRLHKDAQSLFWSGSFRSALALAIISIEEVGKIIEDVLWAEEPKSTKGYHLKKQNNVNIILASQVCSKEIGKNISLPRSDEETAIECDDEIVRLLYDEADKPGTGAELGRYLFFKSKGTVDPGNIRRCATYRKWLSNGTLHRLKNTALYEDAKEEDTTGLPKIDHRMTEDVLRLSSYCIDMCDKLLGDTFRSSCSRID